MRRRVRKWMAYVLTLALVVGVVFASDALTAQAKQVARIRMDSTENGAYSGYHATPDKTFLYKQSGAVHVVSLQNNTLTDYTLSKTYSVKSKITTQLPKYQVWGGYFHSEHGQNYVAVGYNNPKENAKQTVIKVLQYDKKWKKKQVARIMGGASNPSQFTGVTRPFYAGNVSFAEYANTLYLFTSRMMFKEYDGVNHQTNIAFSVDTKKMTAKVENYSFASHSFNQFCKFQDGNLYLVDHGDSHPRGVQVTIYDAYGKFASQAGVGAHRGSATALTFAGESSNNETGATVGGMEVSSTNVLVAGTAQPHNSTVGGVSGFSSSYGQNLYLIKRNRSTGGCSVRWLTNYNPKSSGMTVDRSRLVKISNNRFAIIYSVLARATGTRTCYCMLVDDEGKTLKTTEYKDIQFRGGTQPIVSGDKIILVEKPSNSKAQIYEISAK